MIRAGQLVLMRGKEAVDAVAERGEAVQQIGGDARHPADFFRRGEPDPRYVK